MNGRIKIARWTVLAGVLISLGCASREGVSGPARLTCPEGVTAKEIATAAHDVLADMRFTIEKLDADQGLIRTRPLRAAQFFEFWRSDNVGGRNTAEANLQSVRKTVELRIDRRAADDDPQSKESRGLSLACDVQVQRLSLPGNEVAGVSQAYRTHTGSAPVLQRFQVTERQQQGMAWIDLGEDSQLAAEILKRIERKLGH